MADESLERITILLQARDKEFARAMDRNNRLIARMSRDAQRNTTQMSRTINQRLDSMSTSALAFGRSFAAGLAGGVVAGAFGMLTTNLRQTVAGIAAVSDQAQQAGVGIEQFQEWGYVAQQNRIGIDAMVDGLKELNLRADEFAVTGAGPAAEAFQRIGYDAQSLARDLQDPSELLMEIVRRMQGLDTAARVRVADEIFGGTAGERFVQLVNQGADGLRRMREEAREVGAVMDRDMIQRATLLDQKFQELTTRVGNFLRTAAVGLFAGGIETSTDALERMFGSLERAQAVLGDEAFAALTEDMAELSDEAEAAAGDIARVFDVVQSRVLRLASDMADVTGQLSDMGRIDELLSFDAVIASMEQIVADLNAGRISADQFEDELSGAMRRAIETLTELSNIDGLDLSGAIGVIGALQGALSAARAEARGLRQDLPGDAGMTTGTPFLPGSDGLFMPPTPNAPIRSPRPRRAPPMLGEPPAPGGGGGGGGSSQDGYLASVEDIRARTTALEMEAAALVAVAASGREYGDAVEFARVRAQLMNEAMRDGRQITPELQAEIDALAEAYVTAGENAQQAADRLEEMRAQSERGIDAMTDLFMGIAQGGDAARQAVSRLISEIARMAAQRGFRALAGGGGGGGFFSFLGGLLGGKRAMGGPVEAGVPYLVNENTPNSEIFVPSRSGAVLNVPQAQAAMRGAGGGMAEVVVRVDDDGKLRAFVERTTGSVVARARPAIVQESVRATYAANTEVPFR